MCGISGIVFKKNNVDNNKIISMNEILSHRGPDHSGYLRHKNLLLGHTRLSIIDLSSKGTLPMSNDGRFWIIYNGEIYNYLDLKEELIQKCFHPRRLLYYLETYNYDIGDDYFQE